jgi:hypothetical protein
LGEEEEPNKRSLHFGHGGKRREWSLLTSLKARILAHHPIRMAYSFTSSAILIAILLHPLHAIFAVKEKHICH